MKVLLLGEFSGLNNELKHALREYGHNVTLAASNDFYKAYPSDINLGRGNNIYLYKMGQLILPVLNLRALAGYDVVHIINFYIFPRMPLLNCLLVKFLQKHNQVVTLAGAGSDPFFVRHSEATMRYSPIPPHERYDRGGKRHYMRKLSHLNRMHQYMKHVDGVIPIMYEYYSTFRAAGYSGKTCKPIPIPINCDSIKFTRNALKNKKVVFFHGLTRRGFKGTFLIEKCFEQISKKYPRDVECIIDGKMPFDEYMKVVAKTNVAVDQVFSYSLSMNSLYSMAQGKVVCGGAEPESAILYDGKLPPVYNLRPVEKEIAATLEELLANRHGIVSASEESRHFVREHHLPSLVAERYTRYWASLMSAKKDEASLAKQ